MTWTVDNLCQMKMKMRRRVFEDDTSTTTSEEDESENSSSTDDEADVAYLLSEPIGKEESDV